MSYRVAVIFHPDPEFWDKDDDCPDEGPYSWSERKDFNSIAEAEAWVTNHYDLQDLDEYFATMGLWLQIASDLERDGMTLELFKVDGELAVEIFYSDVDGSIKITHVSHPITAEDFEFLISTAKRRLTPTNTEADAGNRRSAGA